MAETVPVCICTLMGESGKFLFERERVDHFVLSDLSYNLLSTFCSNCLNLSNTFLGIVCNVTYLKPFLFKLLL